MKKRQNKIKKIRKRNGEKERVKLKKKTSKKKRNAARK